MVRKKKENGNRGQGRNSGEYRQEGVGGQWKEGRENEWIGDSNLGVLSYLKMEIKEIKNEGKSSCIWGAVQKCVYLQASYAQQAPRPPLSGFPRSERGTVWRVHCPVTPTTHPDRTPPCKSHTDCCLCPPGTSAAMEGGRETGGRYVTQSDWYFCLIIYSHVHASIHPSTYLLYQRSCVDNKDSVLWATPQLSSNRNHFGDRATGRAQN